MTPIVISSPEDPRITAYLNVRDRDLIGRGGLFIAEGEVVLRVLATSTIAEAISVLVTETRVESLGPVLAQFPASTMIYVASQAVMDQIVGFHIHRGVIALGRRLSPTNAAELLTQLPERSVVLGLIGISNHDNMGGIFRNAAAFGVNAIIADDTSCDPLYRKSIRVSVGGVFRVPFARSNTILDDFKRFNIEALALSPRGGVVLSDLASPPRAGVILGAEGPGLPKDVLEQCRTVRIEMIGGFDSLNVATTCGIVLHHLGRGTSRFARP